MEAIGAYPNWDPIRKVLVVHDGEREAALVEAYGAQSQAADELGSGSGEIIDLETLNRMTAEILASSDAGGEAGAQADDAAAKKV